MTVTITITSPGADTGPFDLYHNLNGFSTAFETSVPKLSLTAGYLSNLVPDGATIIRVQSTGTCTNYIDLAISGIPATTTTTTAAPTIIPVEWTLSNGYASTVISRELKLYKNGTLIQLITSDGSGTINYALNDTIRVTIEINFPPPFGNQYLSIYDQTFNAVFIDSSGSNTLLDSGNILLDSLSGITNLEVYGYY